MSYTVVIDSVDRTDDVDNRSIIIEDRINDITNTCNFDMVDRNSLGFPDGDEEIVITVDGTKLFAGYITSVRLAKARTGAMQARIYCIDYVRLLDRNLVHKSYESETDAAIIADIISTYAGGAGITDNNVIEGVTIDQISFNYIQPSKALSRLAQLTGRHWYIDYDKDIHYFPLTQSATPFNIDSSNNDFTNLNLEKDSNQIKNRIYVRGGTKLSDATTHSEKGDGVKTKFNLPDKPHNMSLAVNGDAKTVGIKNIDLSGYDWYLNYQEKYVEQDAGGSVLGTGDTLEVNYQYDIPILVAVEDRDSIEESGQHEFAIFDKSITTTQAARDRASAELTDYADSVIEASFETMTTGFLSGQYLNINLTDYGVNANYIVQKVVARSMGGGVFNYFVYLASAKTMGIIKFLINLLEADRNLVELDDDEVVDELFELTDSLNTDSLLDSLIIDSAGPYRTWCIDSLEATSTRARWQLFQWG